MQTPTRSARIALLLVALFSGWASLAMPVAQSPAPETALPSRLAEEYRLSDRNADGRISRAEIPAGEDWLVAFRESDDNCDALLDPEEFGTARAFERRQRVAGYFADAWLTARVKARLLFDDLSTGLDIAVSSHAGTVNISGQLDDAEQASRVVKVASRIEGVEALYAALALMEP